MDVPDKMKGPRFRLVFIPDDELLEPPLVRMEVDPVVRPEVTRPLPVGAEAVEGPVTN